MITVRMKSGYIIVAVILISVTLAGCSEPPSSPVSEMPKVVIDNEGKPQQQNSTIIFIHGMDEVRYSNISLHINSEEVLFKNETFCAEYRTNLTEFNLTVDIWFEKTWYNFNATLNMSEKKDVAYKITYYDGDTKEIKLDQLPYVERANQMEEKENA